METLKLPLLSPWRKIYYRLGYLIKRKLPLAVRICLFYFPGKPVYLWIQLPLLLRLFKMGYYQRISNLVKFDIKNQSVLNRVHIENWSFEIKS